MRLNLDLENLHVETTEMQPEIAEAFAADAALAASILWNTQTEPIQADTRSSPCVA
ncbi:hypothetical protein [Longimicrobium sp.]|uniref:hypothetical protein n=1 Tax=Longimicrobium sp. TaxID=2029185 RepID=UPI002E347F59|nr:hypothetical protein [Longimicrobium sp.]HEX6038495.1 hypothetical protein [Longimicrobium sp.]